MNVIITGSSIPLVNILKKEINKRSKLNKIHLISIVNKKRIKTVLKNEKIIKQNFKGRWIIQHEVLLYGRKCVVPYKKELCLDTL